MLVHQASARIAEARPEADLTVALTGRDQPEHLLRRMRSVGSSKLRRANGARGVSPVSPREFSFLLGGGGGYVGEGRRT
jgi:hypothetical protein